MQRSRRISLTLNGSVSRASSTPWTSRTPGSRPWTLRGGPATRARPSTPCFDTTARSAAVPGRTHW
jgi:hypothetical protein